MATLMGVALTLAVAGFFACNHQAFDAGFPTPLRPLCRAGDSTFLDLHKDMPDAQTTLDCY
jgi:hypothetical protein